MLKILSKVLLIIYLVVLTWLILFKLTLNFAAPLGHNSRSLNLIPFGAPAMVNGKVGYGEMILNAVIFIPFGLLLRVNFKELSLKTTVLLIVGYSLIVELIQYIFGIGSSDITDLLLNCIGGCIGLLLYHLSARLITTKKLDIIVISIGALLVTALLYYRFHYIVLR